MDIRTVICKRLGKNKEAVKRLVNNGALNYNHEIATIECLLKQIKEDRRELRNIDEKKNVLQSYEEFTRWGHGSEDGDWVFMTMREDELKNAKEKYRRIQRRERKLKK